MKINDRFQLPTYSEADSEKPEGILDSLYSELTACLDPTVDAAARIAAKLIMAQKPHDGTKLRGFISEKIDEFFKVGTDMGEDLGEDFQRVMTMSILSHLFGSPILTLEVLPVPSSEARKLRERAKTEVPDSYMVISLMVHEDEGGKNLRPAHVLNPFCKFGKEWEKFLEENCPANCRHKLEAIGFYDIR